jgi:serine/threonine protein kinase/Tfp pilus assembly protein PilF
MGTVYRALDLQLGRPLALKFVSEQPGSDTVGTDRLLREAQAAASLNHPNICTIYAAGESEGRVFIAMEYLEGSDLAAILKEGPLPWGQALSICRQVASALAEAHRKNILHRDIKSSNIFVNRQRVAKLLDFGIAVCVADASLTQAMTLVGTPSYMSPEQIEYGIANAQSDIWGLGVVFYEMLTGKLPFGVKTKSTLSSILIDQPTPITTVLPGIPPLLEQIVTKALQKNPENRYGSAEELLVDLERADRSKEAHVTGTFRGLDRLQQVRGEAQEELRTIAVLPLNNLSSNPADEYICDGLAEELINGLTKIEGLRVVSGSSSFQFRGTTLDPREIGRKLRASHLVNGSLRRSGDQLRLTAQLSETREGYLLWSHRFDADMKDLFRLQDELSGAVLERLRVKLSLSTPKAQVKAMPGDPAAYEMYLRARHFYNQQTGDGLREAVELLTRALELDPEQAPVHIALAESHALLEWYGLEPTSEAIPQVKKSLESGLNLDPNSFAGLCLLASVQAGYDWDWETAELTFQSAMAVAAGSAAVWFHYALDLLTPLGRLEEALTGIRNALQLDPLSAITSTALGGCYYRMGRWSEAATCLRTTLELHPGFGHAHLSLGRVLLEQGEGELALEQFDEAMRIMGTSSEALAERGYCLARVGRREEACAILTELDSVPRDQFVSPISYALIYAGMDDRANALAHLERAFKQRARRLTWVNADPRFHSLREDAGFRQLLSRIGLPFEPRAT